eukprot:328322_1
MAQEGETGHEGLLATPADSIDQPEPGSIDERRKKRVRTGLICCHFLLWYTIGGGLFFMLIWLFFGCILYPCGNAGRRCFTIARVCLTPLRYNLQPAKCCRDCKKCGKGFCGGLIWAIAIGFHIMIFHFFMALIFLPWYICKIPMSRTHIKLGRIALRPFSATITRKEENEMYYAVDDSSQSKNKNSNSYRV